MPDHVVVMGVAGCGKSTLAAALGAALGWPVIEGDDFHPPRNKARMQAGVPLTDADRADWLTRLAEQLQAHPHGAVLSCSALKHAYRERLRAASPGLRFVHLALAEPEALRRVTERAGHFFTPALVHDQFTTLEDPEHEPGVLTLDATQPLEALTTDCLKVFAA